MAGTIYNGLVISLMLCISLLGSNCSRRVERSTPVVTEIYALDHFIELVEKIEEKVTGLYLVADLIRSLAYKDDYWKNVIRIPSVLPAGTLTSNEQNILTKMVTHKYSGVYEEGVVRTSSGDTIAIGSLMTGIMAGIYRNRELSLEKWATGASKVMDNLYAATIARNLAATALAKANTPSNAYFGPGGSWNSNDCPEKYTKGSGSLSKASHAQLLGDIDGFILGSEIESWARTSRLGQIIRMYYSTGICFDKTYASCERIKKLKKLTNEDKLAIEVEGVVEAMYLKNTNNYPNVKKSDFSTISKAVAKAFFPKIESVSVKHACETTSPGCELPANLVFMMDESGSIKSKHFTKEKQLVSDIVDAFNISPRQTKVALIEFGSKAAVDFNLDVYGSKTRLRCAIKELRQGGGKTNTAGALYLAIDIFQKQQQRQQPSSNQRTNIAILLTDGKSNWPNDDALKPAINDTKHSVKDLTMFAVGVGKYDMSELKSIATDPKKHIITASNFDQLLTQVKKMQNQTCSTPTVLDLYFNRKGKASFVDVLVSQKNRRIFTIPSAHFYGSSINLQVTPKNGKIRVFASRIREAPGPDNYNPSEDYKLDPIEQGQPLQFRFSNPCKGANSSAFCNPLHLGFYHADSRSCTCNEKRCFLPAQIMFRVEKGVVGASATSCRPSGFLFFVLVSGVALIQTFTS